MKKILLMLLLIISNCWVVFSQDNYRIENFGNRSLLLSGNVTGSVEDLGSTYSFGRSSFDKPDDTIPVNGNDINIDQESASIILSRWRFIVGIEIPILSKKLEEIK